ncbi:hypothetical protein C5E20_00660 [Pectobacterium parmentieri]|uniref:hypothetical protein n=1 Tax=Pectobacterium parmentieri TaxID=1905730 RepID=UPI000EB5A78D|nr:hypothetical protein [Pectobacterium parmentieri]AYH25808.1 hypothetical protein C5E20_00660 [Pectobacterium parmentieri]
MKKDGAAVVDITDRANRIPNHGYLIWTGDFKNGTLIGTVPCDGSICGGLSTCKDELTGNAT